MQRLDDKVALVAGGAGEVGEGIVQAFLEAGARVIVPSRSQDKLAALRQRLNRPGEDRLLTLVAYLGTQEGADDVRAHVQEHVGQLDAVVASLGGWWQGTSLVGISTASWQRIVTSNLTSHFITARTFLPMLANRSGSSYLFINGAAAEHPVPQAGPVSIMAAAQLMMKDVLAKEMEGEAVRINSLIVGTPVVTRSRHQRRPGWLTAEDVGRYAVYLASEAAEQIRGQSIRFQSRMQLEEQAPSGTADSHSA